MSERTFRVLGIVEDEADMRMLLRITLSADPRIEVGGEASSAERALELAAEWNPDLIVLDQSLDGVLKGTEAAPMFKAIVPDSKILLFSAYDLASEAKTNPAIDRFLRKDNIRSLLPTVKEMLGMEPVNAA